MKTDNRARTDKHIHKQIPTQRTPHIHTYPCSHAHTHTTNTHTHTHTKCIYILIDITVKVLEEAKKRRIRVAGVA